jgi:outer membrane protein OmpA-like peptidoglycan-associated protein
MKKVSLLPLSLAAALAGGYAAVFSVGNAYADGESHAAPKTVFSDQDPKGKGPYSGKRAGENQAGAGGYNKAVKNPGGMIAPLPSDDQHDMQSEVPRQQSTVAGEATRRKSPAVGRGNSADNARLDPATGKRMLPDTAASSNPANPNAPSSPGSSSTNPHSENRLRGEQNAGAFADMSVPAGGGTPKDEMERSRALSVMFDQGASKLSAENQQTIDNLIAEAKARGSIDAIKVITWGDQAGAPGKLPKNEQELAEKRAEELKSFVKQKTTDISVSTINMAKKPGALAELINYSNKNMRDQLERTGLAAKEGGKGSRAIVMVIMRR